MNILYYLKNPTATYRRYIKMRNLKSIQFFNSTIELSQPELKQIVEDALQAFHDGGGFKYDFNIQKFKLYSLFKLLNFLKPKIIAELGSGSTTAILNYYSKKEQAQVVVLEESSHWKLNTEKLLEITGGQNFKLKIHECQRLIIEKEPVVTRYDFDYSLLNFDLIIIDGPSTELNGVFKSENFNCDLLNILELYYPKAVLIDNRKATYNAFKNNALDNYIYTDTVIWTLDQKIHNPNNMNFYSYAIRKEI